MGSPDTQPASLRTRILLVDDNQINRKVVYLMLSKIGVIAQTASSGEEAIEKAADGNFDLILMDLHMPGMGGIEAARKIREKLGDEAPAIVALTADVVKGMDEQVRVNGMAGYLTKPISSETLKTCLAEHGRQGD